MGELLDALAVIVATYARRRDGLDDETKALVATMNERFVRHRVVRNDDTDPVSSTCRAS